MAPLTAEHEAVGELVANQDDSDAVFDLVDPCPEITSIPGYTPPITLQVLDAAELAPKDEKVIYKQHAQMFRRRDGEWKERGVGDVMFLRHLENGSVRLLMWQDRTYKTIANFRIVSAASHCHLVPHADDPLAWEWACHDYSDDRIIEERFAIHFKTEQLALEFKEIFDSSKESTHSHGKNIILEKPFEELRDIGECGRASPDESFPSECEEEEEEVGSPQTMASMEEVDCDENQFKELAQARFDSTCRDISLLGLVGLCFAWLVHVWLRSL